MRGSEGSVQLVGQRVQKLQFEELVLGSFG